MIFEEQDVDFKEQKILWELNRKLILIKKMKGYNEDTTEEKRYKRGR